MKVLTICPTKNNPKECKRMVDSFADTIELDNTLLLGINIDETMISEYREIRGHKVLCRTDATVTQIINDLYKEHPGFDYIHVTNDDVIYHTRGWDRMFVEVLKNKGGGIAYGDDMFQGKNLPTFPFISRETIESVGYVQLPRLNRYFGDMVWKHLGELAGCLYYLGGIKIEHMHNLAGKSTRYTDMEVYTADQIAWASWLPESHFDSVKIREALNGK